MHDRRVGGLDDGTAAWMWIAFVALASLGLSRAVACAVPLAAVAALAALTLPRRKAAALVFLVWAANQAIGFGLLHYPRNGSTLGWGGAIGTAALASLGTAWAVDRRVRTARIVSFAAMLPAAFAAYEVVLWAATGLLPSGPGAFAPLVVLRLLAINAATFGLLIGTRRLLGRGRAPVHPAVAMVERA